MNVNLKKILKDFSQISIYKIYTRSRDKRSLHRRSLMQGNLIKKYLEENVVTKLQIGCGTNILKGWLNTDLNDVEQICFLDAGVPFPIKSNCFDFIFSEHLFEHLTVQQQLNMLSESHRILKKGGAMRIATPNFEFLFNMYKHPLDARTKNYVNWAVKKIPQLKVVELHVQEREEHHIYVINNFFKAWGHQMIHSYSSLEKMAIQTGYSTVRKVEVGKSEIDSLKNLEQHGTIIPEEMNLFESMVVELIK